MRRKDNNNPLEMAIDATGHLLWQRLSEFQRESSFEAHLAHSEIESLQPSQKSSRFYLRFLPLLAKLSEALTEAYRRYFKMALANPVECAPDPHEWAWNRLQDSIQVGFEWIYDWWVLACDGENRYVKRMGPITFEPGKTISISIPTVIALDDSQHYSWYAPCWTFVVSPATGISHLKTKNVPEANSDEKLSQAQTRLVLKAMRRVFVHKLRTEIENAKNEETAAAGVLMTGLTKPNEARVAKPQPKGFEGLGEKLTNLSRYTEILTDKQSMAFSLKNEYGLGPTEVASRMGIDRKTVSEHLALADKKINERFSNERKARRSENSPE